MPPVPECVRANLADRRSNRGPDRRKVQVLPSRRQEVQHPRRKLPGCLTEIGFIVALAPCLALPSARTIGNLGIRPLRCHEAVRVLIEHSLASTAAEVVRNSSMLRGDGSPAWVQRHPADRILLRCGRSRSHPEVAPVEHLARVWPEQSRKRLQGMCLPRILPDTVDDLL